MDAAFEQLVRERAYEIWKTTGMESGSADTHWFSAEKAMRSEADAARVKPVKAAKAAKTIAKPAKTAKGAEGAKLAAAKSVASRKSAAMNASA